MDFETFEIDVPELELLLKRSRGENGYFDKSELVDAEIMKQNFIEILTTGSFFSESSIMAIDN